MGQEANRRYLRVKTKLLVKYNLNEDPLAPSRQAYAHDISVGGIKIVTTEPLSLGAKLRIEISLANQTKPVTLIGKVVWVDPNENQPQTTVGVEYIDADSQNISRITEYILSYIKNMLVPNKKPATPEKVKPNLRKILNQELRLPGDKSPCLATPAFLSHEINIPGDKIKFCRIQSGVSLKLKLINVKTPLESKSMAQYISGGAIWLLLDHRLTLNTNVEIVIELPGLTRSINAFGQVVSQEGKIYCDDTQSITLYQTRVNFTEITNGDRAQIVRYVYNCRRDYIMLGKNPPSEWL